MAGLTLDAGPLILLDRGDRRLLLWLKRANELGLPPTIPAPALAQAWRGPRSTQLGRLLSFAVVDPLDEPSARRVGELCGRSGTADIADAAVVVSAARRGDRVLTTDPDDIARLSAYLPGVTGILTPDIV